MNFEKKDNIRIYSLNYIRHKFINQFLIDGKKYNSFFILNNVFSLLNLENKNNYKIFKIFFKIIEPLFYIEKVISFRQAKQHIMFLPVKKRIRAILLLLKQSCNKNINRSKNNEFSDILSKEIFLSLFKNSYTFNTYKLQNLNFLKLKNNINYKWQ